jgi:hypothetical protein
MRVRLGELVADIEEESPQHLLLALPARIGHRIGEALRNRLHW